MRIVSFLLAFLLTLTTAAAAPWHQGLLDDLKESGDVGAVKEEGAMKMSYILKHPKPLVALSLTATLENVGFPLESTSQGVNTSVLITHWQKSSKLLRCQQEKENKSRHHDVGTGRDKGCLLLRFGGASNRR